MPYDQLGGAYWPRTPRGRVASLKPASAKRKQWPSKGRAGVYTHSRGPADHSVLYVGLVGEEPVVRVSRVTWGRAMIVLAVLTVVTAVVVVIRVLVHPPTGRAPTGAQVDTSKPLSSTSTSVQTAALAPPPPGFPDLDGFTDVSRDHDVSRLYPMATFTSPTGLQCAMWSNRGSTAAACYGAIPGLDHPTNHVYAGDYNAYFDQISSPATDNLNGKPLASGEKVILGAGGNLMGGDQITCGVQDVVVACMVIREFRQNHGDETAQRHGFVLDPQRSWTF